MSPPLPKPPIHFARRGYYKTACGEYTEDTADPDPLQVTSRSERVTCAECMCKIQRRKYAIGICKACKLRFVYVEQPTRTWHKTRCRPCDMIAQACVHERAAQKLRADAESAKLSSDKFVVEIERRHKEAKYADHR